MIRKCKIFEDYTIDNLEKQINEFLRNRILKIISVSQSESVTGSSRNVVKITITIIYETM